MSRLISAVRRNVLPAAIAAAAATAIGLALTGPAAAFDGWHQINATLIPSSVSGYDYVSVDGRTGRLFIGHRRDGLQVFDPARRGLVTVIKGTIVAGSNGAVISPEFDLGVSNNSDGTLTPFGLSTLEARPVIKLGDKLDTSHYDPATHRLVVTLAGDKDGTDLMVLDIPSLGKAGTIHVASTKPEGAAADGKGGFFLAAQELDKLLKIDTKTLQVTAEWALPGCGKPTSVAIDPAWTRVFVGCRGRDVVKPSLAVVDGASGRVITTLEMGGGGGSLEFDPELKRIFSANGVAADLAVFEEVDADSYRPVEALGTRPGLRTMAMDHKTKTIYGVAAEGSADFSEQINTAVSPFLANHIFPNSFAILAYGKS